LQPQQIVVDHTPLHVYMEQIVARLEAEGPLTFRALFAPPHNRGRLVGLFLAVLELIRGRRVVAERRGHHIPLQGLGPVAPHPRIAPIPHPRLFMTDTVPAPLVGWESYYVIVGSSAAALTGLQFVVIALINDLHTRASGDTLGAFGTPTVVHFCVALLTASILSAPWATLASPALALGITGLGGLLYAAIVIRRARRQKDYQPVFEDWLFHTILPVGAYGAIVGGALSLVSCSLASGRHNVLQVVGTDGVIDVPLAFTPPKDFFTLRRSSIISSGLEAPPRRWGGCPS